MKQKGEHVSGSMLKLPEGTHLLMGSLPTRKVPCCAFHITAASLGLRIDNSLCEEKCQSRKRDQKRVSSRYVNQVGSHAATSLHTTASNFSDTKCQKERHKTSLSRRSLLQRTAVVALSLVPPCHAAIESPAASYDAYAASYDILDGRTVLTDALGLTDLRSRLLSRARGVVLEIAVGTGLNLPLYNPAQVLSVTALDLSKEMLSRAEARALTLRTPVRLLQASAEQTELGAGGFDTVVDTFSLCTFADPLGALREMKRVLRHDDSSATVLLLEHTVSPSPVLAAYQNFMAMPSAALSKGCFGNQDVLGMVRKAGFHVKVCEYRLGGTVVYLELGV